MDRWSMAIEAGTGAMARTNPDETYALQVNRDDDLNGEESASAAQTPAVKDGEESASAAQTPAIKDGEESASAAQTPAVKDGEESASAAQTPAVEDGEESASAARKRATNDGSLVTDESSDGMVGRVQRAVSSCYQRTRGTLVIPAAFLLSSLAAAYLAYCLYLDLRGAIALLVFACLYIVFMAWHLVKWQWGSNIRHRMAPVEQYIQRLWKKARWCWYIGLVLAFIIYLVIDVRHTPDNFIALAGIAFFVLVGFVFSTDPAHVQWDVVFSGLAIQVVMGIVILRWKAGADALKWLALQINTFLNYGLVGAEFVFGESFTDHYFAMSLMPILCYFLAVTNLLYHWGVMQYVVQTLGGALQFVMGTSKAEAFVAVGDIFLGPDAAVMMISSSVSDMTSSQLHTVMACGLATIDGGLLPVFESFGIPASHLLSASFMSAPAALAFSKLLCPEKPSDVIKTKTQKLKFEKSNSTNSLEAFSRGAASAVPVIGAVLTVILAFLSILAFVNTTLTWCGHRVGIEELTLQRLFGWILMPMAYLMGVEWSDCGLVAQLIGIKTVVNEFVAYSDLAVFIENREAGLQPAMSVRSEAIATYALCGFSNFGTVGFMLGFLSILAPNKKSEIANVAFRALVASSMACFSTATVAALLYRSEL